MATGSNQVVGFDPRGRVLLKAASAVNGPTRLRDTGVAILVTRRTLALDTISRLDVGPTDRPRVPGSPDVVAPYRMYDRITMAPDGWIAVVRWKPYRVGWQRPDGTTVLGEPINDPVVRVDAAFKAAFLARACERIERVIGGPCENKPGDPVEYGPWPETLPPFAARIVLAAPNGELVVQRNALPEAKKVLYDVVDRAGVRRYQLTLPVNRTLLGFGRTMAYVITTDSVGVQTISRHAWPPPRSR